MSTMQSEERRTALRSAFEVADHLIELAPVPPTSAKVQRDCSRGWAKPGVVLDFYRCPEAVAAFARTVGAELAEAPGEFGGEWFREWNVAGVLAGVPFVAWTRVPVSVPAVQHLAAKAVAA